MRYLVTTALIFPIFTSLAYTQSNQVTRQELTNLANSANKDGVIRTHSVTEYKGTPYFNDWAKGHVIIAKNNITKPILLRYDMEYDAIIFSKNKKTYSISNDKMDGFVLYTKDGDINFRNGFSTHIEGINTNTLLRIIYNGNLKFVAHHTSKLQENLPTYGTANKVSAFENDTNFYLIKENGDFKDVELDEKDILKAIGSMQDELKQYADINNLDFDSESDLKKFLTYYDTGVATKK